MRPIPGCPLFGLEGIPPICLPSLYAFAPQGPPSGCFLHSDHSPGVFPYWGSLAPGKPSSSSPRDPYLQAGYQADNVPQASRINSTIMLATCVILNFLVTSLKKKSKINFRNMFHSIQYIQNIIISTSSIQKLPVRYFTCFISIPMLRFQRLSEIQSSQSIHVVFKRNYIASVFKVKFKLIKMK